MVEERILIVDDNVEMLDKTSELLSHVGYSVVTCTSGEEALERLEHERVDLVLLDINMPSLNGFEVCLRIRQMYALDDLPIIFLTSREDSDSVTKGFHSGASDFISKSAIADILLARVNVHIRLSRTLRFLRDISLTDDLTWSTTSTVTRRATCCCVAWSALSRSFCAIPTCCSAWAATSSWCFAPIPTDKVR